MRAKMIEVQLGADTQRISAELARLGLWVSPLKSSSGELRAFLIDPASAHVEIQHLECIPGVSAVIGETSPHPLVDSLSHQEIEAGGFTFGQAQLWRASSRGGRAPLMIAGPCSFETESLVHQIAEEVASAGGCWLRGGAYKPRTSPYSFQGVGEQGLRWAREAADLNGLSVVTEALSEAEVERVARWSDVIQIGTRNMQNFSLLKRVGEAGKPVLLKRGLCATVDEWLLAGEYVMKYGAPSVIFCERGLRHYDQSTRNQLDLAAAALLKHQYGLPVIVDPSHAAGRRDLILPLAIAAIAMGVDGVMVETHPDPGLARSDAAQALSFTELRALSAQIGAMRPASQEGSHPSTLPFDPEVELPCAGERTRP